MALRTWTGAVNNDASNPGNWSPEGAPQPGDTLTVAFGSISTIDITDNALAGDPLSVRNAHATLNLSDHAQVDAGLTAGAGAVANVDGNDTLNATVMGRMVTPPSILTVNLAANANLFGSFNAGPGANLTISSAGNGRYHNDGTDSLSGARAVIDTDVVGSGMFSLSSGFSIFPEVGYLEFGGSVSGGQTVDISGKSVGFPSMIPAILQVDDPGQFHGTIDLHDVSLADFVGLAQADSWSYKNDLLSINAASGRVLDKFHVISDAGSTGSVHGLTVSKTTAGDVLVRPGTDFNGSFALRLPV